MGRRFASHLAEGDNLSSVTSEAIDGCLAAMQDRPIDLALAFFSPVFGPAAGDLQRQLAQRLRPGVLLATGGEALVGMGRELEQANGLSLWTAHLPDVRLHPMHLRLHQTPDGATFTGWPTDLRDTWPADSSMLLLADPFSFPADLLVQRLNDDQPGIPVVGGMSSGGDTPGQNQLVLNESSHDEGAVAVLMEGIRARTIVSQGCRPIGDPLIVTRSEQNVIMELGGKPAWPQLQHVLQQLANRERQMLQGGLHVGRVVSEYQADFEQGDFLIRNVLGVDEQKNAIAVGDFIRPGTTVQFQLRDHETADIELRQLLVAAAKETQFSDLGPSTLASHGALLFTCNGRGQRMFPKPHHDAASLVTHLGEIPVAGFFAQGEVGPVANKNFLHGFTASIAVF